MSLYELADKTGLDVDLLMKIEHAQTDIDLDTFACICASLDTKPHELVETPGRRFALEYRSTPPDAHTPSKG
jgi:DNA-binding Xre family transcriptional regulator